MEPATWIARQLEGRLRSVLARRKSVLLLGPRQTGKTTLLQQLQPDVVLNFLRPEVRQRYERSPQTRREPEISVPSELPPSSSLLGPTTSSRCSR
ncbi:MAG: hypothetical protein FJ405_15735 [Verrucomicrobia bacterium]|nr:hypothetical protein [Verrucomicrobiota bacterium]